MKKRIFSILITISIFAISCEKRQIPDKFTNFPQTKSLEGRKVNINAQYPLAKCQIYDSLIVLVSGIGKKRIYIYDLNNFNYIASSGATGKGSREIKYPGFPSWDKNKKFIWYPDLNRETVWRFSIDSILQKYYYKPHFSIEVPDEVEPILNCGPFRNNLFSYAICDPEYYLHVADFKGNKIKQIPNKTNIYSNLKKKMLLSSIWYYYTIHPSKNIIFIAYRYADIIIGIDFRGNVLFQKQGPDFIKEPPTNITNMSKLAELERKTTYRGIQSDSNYVYCLYSGRNYYQTKNNKIIPIFGKNIFVFNWKGEPITRIKLNHPTTSFALDKKNNRIITFASDIRNLVYYEYLFSEL